MNRRIFLKHCGSMPVLVGAISLPGILPEPKKIKVQAFDPNYLGEVEFETYQFAEETMIDFAGEYGVIYVVTNESDEEISVLIRGGWRDADDYLKRVACGDINAVGPMN